MSTAKSIGSRFAKWKLVERVSGSIRNKLLLTMLVAALVPLIAVSVVINSVTSSSLMEHDVRPDDGRENDQATGNSTTTPAQSRGRRQRLPWTG